MIRLLSQFALLVLLISCNHPESKDYERHKGYLSTLSEPETIQQNDGYKVIGIKDGDTFVILIDGKEQIVRFAHIDCPEKKQPFGIKAKQFVSDLCFGTNVTLIINPKNKFDRNKRLIAEIILENGKNLNQELVKNGLAWHLKKYSNNQEYAQLEIEAKKNHIGLWSEPNPVAPWEWRKYKSASR